MTTEDTEWQQAEAELLAAADAVVDSEDEPDADADAEGDGEGEGEVQEEAAAEPEPEANADAEPLVESHDADASQRAMHYEPANRSHLTLLDRAIMLLENDCDNRREDDIVPLLGWWRKRSDVFKRLRNETLVHLLKFCDLHLYDEHEIILRQGELGDACYLVLTGKVSVYITYKKKDDDETLAAASRKAEASRKGTPKSPRARRNTLAPVVGRFCAQRKNLGTYVVTLCSGAPFGEMALLSQDRVRKAYVVADEHMYVMVISRQLFDATIKSVMEDDYRDKRTLINNHQLFAGWRPDYKEQLAMAFERYSFPSFTFYICLTHFAPQVYDFGKFSKKSATFDKSSSKLPLRTFYSSSKLTRSTERVKILIEQTEIITYLHRSNFLNFHCSFYRFFGFAADH